MRAWGEWDPFHPLIPGHPPGGLECDDGYLALEASAVQEPSEAATNT